MSAWFNYAAAVKILLVVLAVGAGLPALFAIGVRLNAGGAQTCRDDAVSKRNLLVLLSWLIFAVVLVAVTVGMLFLARDFIGHHTGWHIFVAQRN